VTEADQSRRAPTIGLFSINSYACADPATASAVAGLAETLGYDSVWAGEHVVLPSPQEPPSPMDPREPILDPMIALAHIAGCTSRIRLGTGVIVLPQRNPLVLAKQLASLDVLSRGRLIFGMGVGYLEPEMRAVGTPMAGRADRSVEYLAAMRSLWDDDTPEFRGAHVAFSGIDAYPRPVQRPLPVVMGGHSRSAQLRAARLADGWYGYHLRMPETADLCASIRRAEAETGREHPLHISVTPGHLIDRDKVRAYGALGVDRLIIRPRPGSTLPELLQFVEAYAPARVGASVRDD
jgi:probable F420-dependent oxidoreductase